MKMVLLLPLTLVFNKFFLLMLEFAKCKNKLYHTKVCTISFSLILGLISKVPDS